MGGSYEAAVGASRGFELCTTFRRKQKAGFMGLMLQSD